MLQCIGQTCSAGDWNASAVTWTVDRNTLKKMVYLLKINSGFRRQLPVLHCVTFSTKNALKLVPFFQFINLAWIGGWVLLIFFFLILFYFFLLFFFSISKSCDHIFCDFSFITTLKIRNFPLWSCSPSHSSAEDHYLLQAP